MSNTARCPSCDKLFRIPEDKEGKRVRCAGCSTVSRIERDDDGELTLVAAAAPPESAREVCATCGAELSPGSTFCTKCGGAVGGEAEEGGGAAKAAGRRKVVKKRVSHTQARNKRKIAGAGRYIMILAVLLAIAGTLEGYGVSQLAKSELQEYELYEDSEILEFEDGTEITLGELRDEYAFEVYLVFGINYLLVAILIGLYFWARKAPLPAILTALCLYVVLLVLNAIIDPSTIARGLLIKALVISGLLAGLRAALSQRALERAEG